MLRRGGTWVEFSTRLKLGRIRNLCTRHENGGKKAEEIESRVAHYNETYKKLENLDFMTAAKILFTEPPKKKKFGLDFHLVQLFFACLPSLAVYLVAQYARRKMKLMDAELEEKKKKKEDEQKAREEAETVALEEQERSKSEAELAEVKERLIKIEKTIKEIVVESKKHSGDNPSTTQAQSGRCKPTEGSQDKSESSKENPGK
ncbi:PREDICTED: uncharacterized protein LOC104812439 [Tarenaya hassleriana]|uniref:uncharacterized protein LOC104812439 n=1 Tax=Tarenaya hassleriana TaxID=28532 RepID=UPI00053C0FB2|nr:PREDICTED: uncharacterized protein LOC104812439 [Tarenaya hassleriana]